MDEALKVAVEEFKKLDFGCIPQKSGTIFKDNKIKIKYLNRWYLVSPDAEVIYLEGEGGVSKREKLVVLHYLAAAKEIPLSGKLIDFREVPGGNMYYSVFEARVYQPFLAFLGVKPSVFIEASAFLSGEKVDYGDIAFKFTVLPMVPVSFIFYRGDEEFPSACKVLFDSSIPDYLPTEDIAVICEDTIKQLKLRITN